MNYDGSPRRSKKGKRPRTLLAEHPTLSILEAALIAHDRTAAKAAAERERERGIGRRRKKGVAGA